MLIQVLNLRVVDNMSFEILLYFSCSLLCGTGLGWFLHRVYRVSIIHSAELDAEEIVQDAKDRAEIQSLEEKEKTQEIETEIWTKEEPGFLKIEERIEELEEICEEKKTRYNTWLESEKQKISDFESSVAKDENKNQQFENKVLNLKKEILNLNQQFVQKISQRVGVTKEEILNDLCDELIKEAQTRADKQIQYAEESTKEHSEDLGKNLIDSALVRFQRAYCGERGIAPVYFEMPEQRQILCDPDGKNIKCLQEITGCDIIVENDMELVGVAGFDPVRRELTRRLLERILKERKTVSVDFIKEKAEHIKRELFAVIKRDGDQLAKELGLQGLHPEIRQMMGSLRYRYSFTQNQYFHCAEVGWLCGLLAQELGTVDLKKARRAGMLHDLGKSMDHALDGGHAVIGANFIEARKEAADIVHAVRSHHFDETPSTDLAYLVIAADAISGARPGARRSTMETYNQKVTELDNIARSFEGVTDCFVLNGGRELRVLVNGKKVDDLHALKIGRDMALRIENECNYPGQIKVVVVRETYAVETTRHHG